MSASGTHHVSLSGVLSDDGDSLTMSAASCDPAVASVSVAADYSSLSLSANAAGMATVTVTADDGQGGRASDMFTVTVSAAPQPEAEDVVARYDTDDDDGKTSLAEYNAAVQNLGTTLTMADLIKILAASVASARRR